MNLWRSAIALILFAVLAESVVVWARPPDAPYKIGLLTGNSCRGEDPSDVFGRVRQALAKFGYVDGKSIVIECRVAAGDPEVTRLPAQDLVALGVDIIIAHGTPPALAAQRATKTIPVIMFNITDPVARGLVASLARPGANVTGLANLAEGQTLKGFELLQEGVPNVTRVTVFTDLANEAQAALVAEQDGAARIRGLKLQRLDVRSPSDLDAAFAAVLRERSQAIYIYPLRIPRTDVARIIDFSIKHRLPTMAAVTQAFLSAGVLFFHSHSLDEQYYRLGVYVDRVLKGAKPAELPVERPTKFDLIINLQTAHAIGLVVPESLLVRADRVIK
jgi:putative ABC transport system substrate-binding protein